MARPARVRRPREARRCAEELIPLEQREPAPGLEPFSRNHWGHSPTEDCVPSFHAIHLALVQRTPMIRASPVEHEQEHEHEHEIAAANGSRGVIHHAQRRGPRCSLQIAQTVSCDSNSHPPSSAGTVFGPPLRNVTSRTIARARGRPIEFNGTPLRGGASPQGVRKRRPADRKEEPTSRRARRRPKRRTALPPCDHPPPERAQALAL